MKAITFTWPAVKERPTTRPLLDFGWLGACFCRLRRSGGRMCDGDPTIARQNVEHCIGNCGNTARAMGSPEFLSKRCKES